MTSGRMASVQKPSHRAKSIDLHDTTPQRTQVRASDADKATVLADTIRRFGADTTTRVHSRRHRRMPFLRMAVTTRP